MRQKVFKILIIDDSAEDRAAFRHFLEKDSDFAYEIFEEELGESGVETCFEIKPDCLLLDYNLPDTDGLTVIKTINPDSFDPAFPVILITGAGDEKLAVKAIKIGAQDYLVKGRITSEELGVTVRNAVEIVNLRRKNNQSEVALRQSVEALKIGMKVADFAICEIDYIKDTNRLSKEAAALFGLGDEEMVVRRAVVHATFHPDDREEINSRIERSLQPDSDGTFAHEHRIVWRNGETRWVNIRKQIFFDYAQDPPRPKLAVLAIQDITARKKSDEKIRVSEERLSLAMNGANIGTFDWNIKTGAIEWSREIEEEMASVPGEFVDSFEKFISLVHPDDREMLQQCIINAMTEGSYECEFRMIKGDDSIRWVIGKGRVFYDDEGRSARLIGVDIDITKRKLTEKTLLENQRFTESIIETAPSVLYTFDLKTGSPTYLTDQAATVLGYSFDEVIDQQTDFLRQYMHPEDIVQAHNHFDKIVESQNSEVFEFEYRMRHKSGEWRWFRSRDRIFRRDADGRAEEILGIALDITERKQAEMEVAALSERNQDILESINDAFFAIDRDWKFSYLNRQAETMIFSEPDAMLGKVVWEEFPGLEGSAFEPIYRQAMDEGIVGNITDFYPDHDRWYEITIYPASNGITVYFRNVTENKREQLNNAFLSDLQRDLATLSTAAAIMELVSQRITDHLTLTRCLFVEVNETADEADVFYSYQTSGTGSLTGVYDRAEYYTAAELEQLAVGKTIAINDVRDQPRSAEAAARFETRDVRALATAPYISEGFWKFVLCVQQSEPRQWSQTEINLLNEVSNRTFARLERARTEEQLRQSEEIFRVASDAAAALVYDVDLTGNRKAVAYGLKSVTGYSSEETALERDWWHSLIHPEDLPGHLENLARHLESNETYTATHRLRRKDGVWIWVEDTAQIIRDEDGNAVQLVGAVVDITVRRESENALRESEERFRAVFDSIDEGFCIIEMIFDAAHKPIDYRFTQVNPAFSRLTGLPAEAVGKTAREFIPGLEDFWFETYGNVALTGKSVRFENYAEPINRWFDVYASRIGNDSSHRVAIVFNNITERKIAENERQKSFELEQLSRREAEAANHAKDEFLAMLSHELRSPLNSMFGWTQILESRDFDAETTRQAMAVITRNIRLQNALIEDLLDVSRIISGKMKLESESVSLVSIIETSLEAARPSAEKRLIKIESNFDGGADKMFGDKHRLQQIIGNLLTNAIKFTPVSGVISVTLERSGDSAKLTVKDSGIGISPELMPYIFDRFWQADASSKRQYGGLGLGLTIVKHLVELHGGTITAYSDGEDTGTTFAVELPLSPQTVSPADLSLSDQSDSGADDGKLLIGNRILVVDDDLDSLNLMRFVLMEKGANVTSVGSAREALLKLRDNEFDLLISDLGMPEMDGYDLIRNLRESENGENGKLAALPAIALTGYVSAEDRERVLAAGFQMHLPKPFNIETLSVIALNLIKSWSE